MVYFIGSSIWFFKVFNSWDYSQACASGWNKLDWINFVFIMIMSFVFTLATLVLLAWLTLAIPVVLLAIVFHYFFEIGGQNQYQNNLILTLVRRLYNPNKFISTKDCAICMEEFNTDSIVTPLPCSIKHYFHTECISKWIENKPECPICRARIS